MKYENTLQFAKKLDAKDPLKKYRNQFLFPKHKGKNVIYFTGNSLGLQPKNTQKYILQELNDWAKFGVEGHFEAKNPWYSYHELLSKPLAKLVGAKPEEVVAMNQLTSNIHFLFVSFYRPTAARYKILCEAKAFPSDQYLIASQVSYHGYDPDEAIIEVAPREGEYTIRNEDILAAIEMHKDELALVFIGGVNYFSGQVFDMRSIAEAGHSAGVVVGFDLAHAIGNIKLALHDWGIDFAAWCSYKYLNSGPGSVGGAFIHQRHHLANLPRFAGWWGHDKNKRFKMEKTFTPIPTAEGWQVSNVPVLTMAAHKAALDIFENAGMNALTAKSSKLTNYLAFVIGEINNRTKDKGQHLEIITPVNSSITQGCQLSIVAHGNGKELFQKLTSKGVIADWREPNVIRIAPVPLYNSFEDVYRFGEILHQLLLK
ncbi:MAG: kynureninase [Bacteroidetes bacterium]|nr:kynureninase [Bacteroidota bacterium]